MLTINDRDRVDWKPGMTVRDVLDAMGYSYPLITVSVNGQVVDREEYDHFPVPDGAQISVFHLAHGG
ncbi:MAG: sulfur carrier protein ThiS [Candidatus Eisenbacteria sp.]|nr:sulfur carrier protein ThiS [Candidatus Eisenbacteria bacterium]